MTPHDVVAAARDCLDVPWAHQRAGSEACDCIGLLIRVAMDLGLLAKPPLQRYSLTPNWQKFCAGLDGTLDRVPGQAADNLTPGHVVGICGLGFVHAGILGPGTLIHSHRDHRRVVEHSLTGEWPRLIRRVWRFRGVDYG